MKTVLALNLMLNFLSVVASAEQSSETAKQASAESLENVLRRLSILEAKENENEDRIKLLEDEVLQLKQKSDEDRQQILQLNLKIKRKQGTNKEDLRQSAMENSGDRESNEQQANKARDENEAMEGNTDKPRKENVDKDDFTNREEKQVNQDWPKNRGKRLEDEHKVAFFASVTPHDVLHLGANQPIIFDNAVVNIGNAYHPYHGIFTAPYDGIYSFTATIFGRFTGGVIYFGISKSGVGYASYEIKDSHQVTQTVILDLKSGDDVSILMLSNDHGIVGHNFTTFSGFMLYENCPSQIVG